MSGLFRTTSLLVALLLTVPSLADKHALLIGIDEYKDRDGITRLSGAENDVDGLASALEQAAGFPKANIETLKGSQATKLAIVEALERLQKRSKPGDIVFFSFAGHGFQPNQDAFLVPFDANAASDGVLRSSSISASDVSSLLGLVQADLMISSYDMCRNNPMQASEGSVKAINPLSESLAAALELPDRARAKRSVVLFSSSPGQRSWEDRSGNRGHYSLALEQGLRGSAARSNGAITVSSLSEFLEVQVPTSVASGGNGIIQKPDIRVAGSGVLEFTLSTVESAQIDSQIVKSLLAVALGKFAKLENKSVSSISYWRELRELLPLFQTAVDLNPDSATASLYLAECTFRIGDLPSDGIDVLINRAITLNPTSFEAHYLRVRSKLDEIPDNAEERERLNELIATLFELEPGNHKAYLAKGKAAFHSSDLSTAKASFRQALEINPLDVDAAIALADLLEEEGSEGRQEAANILKALLQQLPNSARLNVILALILLGPPDEDSLEFPNQMAPRKAIEDLLKHTIAVTPDDPITRTLYASLLGVWKNLRGAEAQLRAALKIDPTYENGYLTLYDVLVRQKKSREAEQLIKDAAKYGVTIYP